MNPLPLPVLVIVALVAFSGVGVGAARAAPAAPKAKPAVALLPTTGDAPRDQRTRLDTAVRKALVADGGYVVLGAKETAEVIALMADQGTICTATELPCLQRLGILADAELLLIPEANGERELDVTITLLTIEDATVVRTVRGPVNLATGSAQKLTDRALHGGDDPDEVRVTPDPLAREPDRPTPGEPIDETKLNDMQFAGVTVAGVGGGIGALALLGALSCEAIFWTGTGTAETRKDVIAPLGSVLWISTIAAGVVAGVGGAVFLAGAPPEDPKKLSVD